MNPALSLAPRLAIERVRGAHGGAVLDVLAIIAFTVSAFLTLTVAAGTWMFVQRWHHPPAQIRQSLGIDAPITEVLSVYVVLAAVACALLVVPVLNLGAAAARLGARGRAQRLASLRLIGMSGGQVVAMSVIETLVQAAAGAVIAAGLWLASLPAWQAVSFHGQPISPGELLMPWWLIIAVILAGLALAAASTVLGLQQVRISPLGVATQQTPRALRAWRLGVFLLAAVAYFVITQLLSTQTRYFELIGVAMILLVVAVVNLVGPWVLQLLARPGAITASVPRLIAMRRIIDDPRGAWRNISGIALLGMVAAFTAIMPTDPQTIGQDPGTFTLTGDVRTGAIITLAVSLLVAAVSTLVNQASLVVDRATESIAMDRAGFPRTIFAAIRRHHVLMPMITTLTLSVGIGLLLATPFMTSFPLEASGLLLVAATAAVGIILTLTAAEACHPLQHRVLEHTQRPND